MKILHRILLATLLPLAAFLISVGLHVQNLMTEQVTMNTMNANYPLFGKTSDLVDKLQIERGTTAMYLSGGTTRETLFAAREKTDGALKEFSLAVPGAVLGTYSLDSVKALGNRLQEGRRVLGEQKTELRPEAVRMYSEFIKNLFELEGAIVNSKSDKGFGKIMGSLFVLEYAKESAGRLRALGASLFALDAPLTETDFTALLTLKSEVDSNLSSPALILTQENHDALKRLPTSAHWADVDSMLSVLVRRADEGGYGIQGEAYFAAISKKISDMNTIIGKQLDFVLNRLDTETRNAERRFWTNVSVAIGTALAALGISLYFSFGIVRRIRSVKASLHNISQGEGDLTVRLAESSDELGELSADFNHFVESMEGMVTSIRDKAMVLDAASGRMGSCSRQLNAGVLDTASLSTNVAAAAERMNSNMASVADNMRQTTSNLETIAAGSEEMSVSIHEIADQAGHAREIGANAAGHVQEVRSIISSLVESAREIGKMSELIAGISSQTNLLALNATIEAARAGEAGRGFAVVASEIKELANQTNGATEQIRARTGAIQKSTETVNETVGRFAVVFDEVGNIIDFITGGIGGQADAMREMAANIAEASSGVADTNVLVGQAASMTGAITADMGKVRESTSQMEGVSKDTLDSASQLFAVAEELKSLVGRFRLT